MKIIRNEKGFALFFKDREIFKHSDKEPAISVGIGKATFEMYRGNFEINDELIEKIQLTDFNILERDSSTEITFSRAGFNALKLVFSIELGRLKLEFIESSEKINRVWIKISAEKDEHIYGCGEQFSYFNLRGRNFPIWTREQGVGRNKNTYETFLAETQDKAGGDYHTTFFPLPTFISSKKYFCHIDESSYMNFDFSHNSYHEIEIWSVPKQIIFGCEDNYVKLLENMTQMLGRQIDIPDWVYNGVWLGMQGGTETVLKKLDYALSKGLKVSGVWAQDWEGKRITPFGKRLMWNWEWDKELYPKLDIQIKNLNAKGIKFLGYINPYLAIEGNLFKEASSKGYIVKNKMQEDYLIDMGAFFAGIVDLTNPDAFNWYKEIIIKNMILFGLSGWMADFGEYLPTDAVLYNGENAEKIHNLYPAIWAKVNREALKESKTEGKILFFMRAGYTGSQKYSTMTWAGDQNVDWSLDDGLASVISAALSLGMSGFGLHHSDIGGYTTLFHMKRTKELFMRWSEMAAFTPLMRTHEGNRPDDNWQFDSDDETLLHFARMSKIYSCLAPYLKNAVNENSKYGTPVMRPLFMHYEQDKKTFDIQYEYLLGRDMLVCPVYLEGCKTWKTYLPNDNWIHLWTGKEYLGGDIEVKAELGFIPVFYRKGSKYFDLFEKVSKI